MLRFTLTDKNGVELQDILGQLEMTSTSILGPEGLRVNFEEGFSLSIKRGQTLVYNGEWYIAEDTDNIEASSVKQDTGKLRYDLLPFDAVDEVVRVLNYGIEKYPNPEENWREKSEPNDIKRYKAAMLRHMSELQQGRTHDIESGLHHMAHITTNGLFIIALEKQFGVDYVKQSI